MSYLAGLKSLHLIAAWSAAVRDDGWVFVGNKLREALLKEVCMFFVDVTISKGCLNPFQKSSLKDSW